MMSASIAGQQTSEFNDLNPPDSGDEPQKARELCVVKSAELFCYTVVVVTDKTGAQSEFQLMQVSLVCSAGFNCNHSCSLSMQMRDFSCRNSILLIARNWHK